MVFWEFLSNWHACLQGLLRDQTSVSCIAGRLFTIWATREALLPQMFPMGKGVLAGGWSGVGLHKRGSSCISSMQVELGSSSFYKLKWHEMCPKCHKVQGAFPACKPGHSWGWKKSRCPVPDMWLDMRGSVRISSSWHFGAHSWGEQTDMPTVHECTHTHDVQTGSLCAWLQVGKGRSCGKSPVGGAGRLPRQEGFLELGTWMAISQVRRTGPRRSRPRARVSPV